MRLRTILAMTACTAIPVLANAQPVSGLYVGAGAGGNFMQHERIANTFRESAYSFNSFGFFGNPGRVVNVPAFSGSSRGNAGYDPGAVGVGSIGFGLGNGLRFEVEGDYRYNSRSAVEANQQKFGAMANALYDFDVGSPDIFPYVGLGGGYMWVNRGYHGGRTNTPAYQGILGVATPIGLLPGLSLTLEYRFLGLVDNKFTTNTPAVPQFSGAVSQTYKYNEGFNHSILFGVRYAFDTPTPPPPAVEQATPPAVQPTRTYLVFFDWDRADLTDRARQIVSEAAQASKRVQTTRIEVQGNADRSGTPAYNQALSLRRANIVAAELVRDGVPRQAIDIQAFGDTRPLVPTAAGVREPQNRRVAIILR